ncbi:universal stress protein [Halosegnis sp.]|uniref:universal stress protein n=1 Tax=Halosegnis sp. TaxID=2864959 RepID=UPI0035D4F6BD
MYDRILVPTDGAPGIERVISHAGELATVHGAVVEFVYVVDSGTVASLPVESSWEGVAEMLREEGESSLASAAETVTDAHPSLEVERTMLEGTPAGEVVRYADRSEADLICMGTHGRGGLNRLLLGSVAERVVRASEVPVLTVRVSE